MNEPLLDGNEERYLMECIKTGWIAEGPFVKRLEEEFAKRVGRKHGVAVCNGSIALDIAVAALGIGPGDEVILPTFTIISCAAAIIRAGAVPILVDCDPASWNCSAAQIEENITTRTKALLLVHIYGLPVDMDPILVLARKYGLKIIEDAAEMHGQTYKGRACGGFGEISTFSFYANKLVTTGEGGILVTDNDALAQRCRYLRNLCFQENRRFVHEELGWNARMSNLQAAVGVAQLERIEEFLIRKRKIGAFYTDQLRQVAAISLPIPRTSYAENAYWVYGLVLDDTVPFQADEVIKRLASAGVGARPFFWPMHEQPVFRKMGLFVRDSHPNAERLARRGLYLPSGLALTEAQALRVVDALREILT